MSCQCFYWLVMCHSCCQRILAFFKKLINTFQFIFKKLKNTGLIPLGRSQIIGDIAACPDGEAGESWLFLKTAGFDINATQQQLAGGVGVCVGFILFNLLISLKSFFLFPFEITGPPLNVYCEKINDVCKGLNQSPWNKHYSSTKCKPKYLCYD